MNETLKLHIDEWLQEVLNEYSCSLEIRSLRGATSTSVYLLYFGDNPSLPKYVLRVFDNQKWLAEEPDLPVHEAAALQEANKTGVTAPEYIAMATKDEGFEVPLLLMSFIEGKVDLKPYNMQSWLECLANKLAVIHRHNAENFPWKYNSWVKKDILEVPSWTSVPHVWKKAIEIILNAPPKSKSVFLHRDYHPLNILWQQSKITGVVDWTNSCQGPAGVDVAHCRTNLIQMLGSEHADQFLKAYQAASPSFIYHPYWDISSVLDMCWPKLEFYKPWQDFGISMIEDKTLQTRIDDYLNYLVNHYDE